MRCRPWGHQYLLRLDDWVVECVRCHRIKREPRCHPRLRPGRLTIDPTSISTRSNQVLETIQKATKAVVAAVTAGVGAYSAAQVAGNVNWVTVLAVALGTGLTVFFAPKNKVA